MRVEILNPKAKKLLQNLAELKLISIEETNESSFMKAVQSIRSKVKGNPPTLEEITKEVEAVRTKRYGKKSS